MTTPSRPPHACFVLLFGGCLLLLTFVACGACWLAPFSLPFFFTLRETPRGAFPTFSERVR